jgi:hypothetical protein
VRGDAEDSILPAPRRSPRPVERCAAATETAAGEGE